MRTLTQNTRPEEKSYAYKAFLGTTTAALIGSVGISNIDTSISYDLLKSQHIYEKQYSASANEMSTYRPSYTNSVPTDIKNFENIINFSNKIIKNSKTVDIEIARIIDENFMDLLA